MFCVYLIGTSQPGFFYIGHTTTGRYKDRMVQHIRGEGAAFTRRHGVLWHTKLEENISTRTEAKRLEWEWVLRLRSCNCVAGGGSSSPDLQMAAAA